MAVRNANPDNEEIRLGEGVIEVAETSFRAVDIEDVEVVAGSGAATARRIVVLLALVALLALSLVVLSSVNAFPQDFEGISRILVGVAVVLMIVMAYPVVVKRPRGAIQLVTNGEDIQIAESSDLQYISETAVRLRLFIAQAKQTEASGPQQEGTC